MPSHYQHLPDSPGVYLMRGARGHILYIGKAGNLKRRVSSYFMRPRDARIQKLVSEIKKIEHHATDTALEALILEARLIHEHQPPYNVLGKDGKSFLYVHITREDFPRVLLVRKNGTEQARPLKEFGPLVSASQVRYALKILRRIFPWHTHATYDLRPTTDGKKRRPCFDYEIGLCPGTCIGAISNTDYRKNIRNLVRFFEGKKKAVIRSLEREMNRASNALKFEQASIIKRQLFALRHIQDSMLLSESDTLNPIPYTPNPTRPTRIEGYDISNISGTSAVGSMVVFNDRTPNTDEYRKFKIRTITQSDDVGMIKEVLRRRFHNNWPLPHAILIDGGKPQVNAARAVLDEVGLHIPTVGIAKGPKRKRNDVIGMIPRGVTKTVLIHVRDEAHRFAISYHRTLRGIRSLGK